jgi:radical SAM superfamily enzyme YgiQ (UPF0313 family)
LAKVGLIDVDNIGKKKISFPNLALMKIAGWCRDKGYPVEWWMPLQRYDYVFKAKVFTFSAEPEYPINAGVVFYGGSGYSQQENKPLPPCMEHCMPDYSIYGANNTAYGFITRGCPNNCPFCIVTEKEGAVSRRVAELGEFYSGQRLVKLLDPNLLACAEHEAILKDLADSGARIDFTQGLDIRLINPDTIRLLNKVNIKRLHFAWDNPAQDLTDRFKRFAALSKIKDYRRLSVYVLVNYASTMADDLRRIETLRDLGYSPYVMVYDKENAPTDIKRLASWVNNPIIFRTVKNFADYDSKKG